MNSDELWMRRALLLAQKGEGRTSPNPLVGAVVVRNGKSIAEGYHAYFGGPHAEISALRKAGRRAQGARLYVSLEPCSSWGKTPPCVDTVIKSRVRQVIIGSADPNPANHRKGIRKLKQAGVHVRAGILGKEVARQNETFFKVQQKGYPFVTLKMAQSLDGKIATKKGESRWISSSAARRFIHRLRDRADAVLVGKNTARLDDPKLLGTKEKEKPWRVILDPKMELGSRSRFFQGPQLTFVVVSEKRMNRISKSSKGQKRILICVPEKKGRLQLKILLRKLARLGVNHLLVEGGGETAWSFIQERLVDRLIWIVAPKIVGGRDAKTSVEGEGIEKLGKAFPLKWEKIYRLGEDWVLESCLRES